MGSNLSNCTRGILDAILDAILTPSLPDLSKHDMKQVSKLSRICFIGIVHIISLANRPLGGYLAAL